MPQGINYLFILFLVIYVILTLIELVRKQSFKLFLGELIALIIIVLILKFTVNFPESRVAFGGVSPLLAVLIIVVTTMLGMLAHYRFYNEKFSWSSASRPLVLTPMILLPLIGTLPQDARIESLQLICLAILAFQNGFFWKIVFGKIKKDMSQQANNIIQQ